MIAADVEHWLRSKFGQWGRDKQAITDEAYVEYLRCFKEFAAIHASCEDYRASAGIDLQHDEQDMHKKISAPLLTLWGEKGFVGRKYDLVNIWKERAENVQGYGLPCGHYLPEEAPNKARPRAGLELVKHRGVVLFDRHSARSPGVDWL